MCTLGAAGAGPARATVHTDLCTHTRLCDGHADLDRRVDGLTAAGATKHRRCGSTTGHETLCLLHCMHGKDTVSARALPPGTRSTHPPPPPQTASPQAPTSQQRNPHSGHALTLMSQVPEWHVSADKRGPADPRRPTGRGGPAVLTPKKMQFTLISYLVGLKT